ncbi:MAG TPA: PPK2 family polyphosphate kinase [Gammaproteobacteria bacterium]|nr:PPK2 family polyphosphate kinase [Gammaproteobacteria bacterium]
MGIDLDRYRIAPGAGVGLSARPTDETQGLTEDEGDTALAALRQEIDDFQERLYAESAQALLIVLQAMDAGGKDSTIRHVFGGLNPQGVRIWNFKAPTDLELAHDFLWRVHKRVPGNGYIGVFNRSHYEDVLIVRVRGWAPAETIERRYAHIAAFERLLRDEGARVFKVMLHISRDYQAERLRRRLERPDKHWKFKPEDLAERGRWDDYMRAFEIALERTSTDDAPWYVVPAETRWFRNLVVASLVRDALRAMDPQYPAPDFDPADYPPESL